MPAVESLQLPNGLTKHMGSDAVAGLMQHVDLSHFANLREMSLRGLNLNGIAAAKLLVQVFVKTPKLKVIMLDHNVLTNHGLKTLVLCSNKYPSTSTNPVFQEVNTFQISSNKLKGERGGRLLGYLLNNMPKLTELSFCDNPRMGAMGLRAFNSIVENTVLENLTYLNFMGCTQRGDEAAVQIIKDISQRCPLIKRIPT
eukprot:Platyproteum_vivax@DN5979_c0_g1_i1.p1